ncbi:Mobile element protein [Limosilactobacillus reuteri subsp. porcinus]|uniref:Mobile element protein n=1 Tax=Limosilactobacillus reuteri TaxID=1598 RepID=A0A0U5JKX4_LIMRT|nr:Mobile element protein [Limosilactobacillus reuteri subsp. porcinus]
MTLVERQSKVMIVLNIHHKTDDAVNCQLDQWLAKLPRHFVKSITFDNGKELVDYRMKLATQLVVNKKRHSA